MFIKASGFLLSDVTENNGYSKVDTKKIVNILKNKTITNEVDRKKREFLAKELVEEATLDKNNRPSIEILLHSTLYKYTLHTHPVVVNMIVIQKEWKETLTSILKMRI
jgi:rhamnose utilization protein RhaD (predicted bifunctional aldolase and dehydrogenase)